MGLLRSVLVGPWIRPTTVPVVRSATRNNQRSGYGGHALHSIINMTVACRARVIIGTITPIEAPALSVCRKMQAGGTRDQAQVRGRRRVEVEVKVGLRVRRRQAVGGAETTYGPPLDRSGVYTQAGVITAGQKRAQEPSSRFLSFSRASRRSSSRRQLPVIPGCRRQTDVLFSHSASSAQIIHPDCDLSRSGEEEGTVEGIRGRPNSEADFSSGGLTHRSSDTLWLPGTIHDASLAKTLVRMMDG